MNKPVYCVYIGDYTEGDLHSIHESAEGAIAEANTVQEHFERAFPGRKYKKQWTPFGRQLGRWEADTDYIAIIQRELQA